MEKFFVFNEDDIAKIIITFINQNVGREAIKEVTYEKLGTYIDNEKFLKDSPIIIDVRCKLDLNEVIKYMQENSSCNRYISSWKDFYREKRNEEIVKLYNENVHYMDIADMFGISYRRVHQILRKENKMNM